MLRRVAFLLVLALLSAVVAIASEESAVVRMSAKSTAADESTGEMFVEAETTSFDVDVMGAIAVGLVRQTFVNDGSTAATMRFGVVTPRGTRTDGIEIEIDGEPVDTPQAAKAARGRTTPASRKRQPAPAVTLEPGSTATVRAVVRMPVTFVDGRYVLELPAIASTANASGDPWPIAAAIAIRVHHDEPLLVAESPTHEIMVSFDGVASRIEPVGGLSERAFRIEYTVGRGDNEPDLAGFVGPELEGGLRDVMMVLSPPAAPPVESVRPKQVLFVVDTSGSMLKDDKLAEAVSAVELCLERLGESDELNVARFANEFELMSETSIVADAAGLSQAVSWLAKMHRGGGTKLLGALGATLQQPERGELHRMIVLITDGNISDEQPVLQLLKSELGEGRLFVVGIGADMNQKTIGRLAEFGRGTAAFVTDAAELQDVITRLFGSVSQPLAWDLTVAADGVEVVSLEPSRVPDLYAGRPVMVRAKVRGGVPAEITVSAETMDGVTRFTARPATDETVEALKRLR